MRRLILCGLVALALCAGARADDKEKTWDETVDAAVKYFRKTQDKDGSWSAKQSVGITGIVVTGLLRTGKLDKKDPMIENALKFLESQIDSKSGHIAGQGKQGWQNYVTCVNVMALSAAERDSYKAAIKDAGKFLTQLQWDEGEDKKADNDFYGGAGYDSKSRPDLSNTQMFLDALVTIGIPKTDPAYKKAIVFVSRCQNLKSEHNDQKWAGKINDGSFVYTAALGGDTKVLDGAKPEDGLPGYGSMTYAGVKSLIYCGVPKNDERIVKATEWIAKNYTVERNPGMPKVREQWGMYYYLHTMAKCLDALGEDVIIDSRKEKHDWRKDITRELAKRQKSDGSWANDTDRWMEGNPVLVSGYALMTLSYTKPKK